MADYNIGDLVEVTATFRNSEGVLANPNSVTLTYLKPGSSTAIAADAPTSDTTGVWVGSIPVDTHGKWLYRFAGTGAVTAAEEGSFTVARRLVPAI